MDDDNSLLILANNIDEVGGVQRVVHTLAQGCAQRGWQVDLAGVQPIEPAHVFITHPEYQQHRLTTRAWPVKGVEPAAGHAQRPELRAEALASLSRILTERKPRFIIAAQVWVMGMLAEVGYGDSIVLGQYHGGFANAASGRDIRRVRNRYGMLPAFAALTDEDAAEFTAAGMTNVVAMPNPLPHWPETAAALDSKNVTYVGRMSEEKGVDQLLSAWALVCDDMPDWSLHLYGDGPLRERWQTESAGTSRVTWHGNTEEPLAVWKQTSIAALPSRTEGLPVMVMEAQAAGVPVVAMDCSAGVRQLTGADTSKPWGVTVPEGDVKGFAAALRRLMDDSEARMHMGLSAREAMNAYRLNQVLDDWEELFAQCAKDAH